MIDLTADQHALLKRIIRTGAAGIEVFDLPLGDTFKLALDELVSIRLGRAVATERGRAFADRVTA